MTELTDDIERKRDHDRIRDELASELNSHDGCEASIERWIGGGETRVDVLLERDRWVGLSRKPVRYGFEVKRETGSMNRLHTQVKQYSDAGVVPVPTLPHPSETTHELDGRSLVEQAESNAFTVGASAVVYYRRSGDTFDWYVYNPRDAGLSGFEWDTVDNRLYDRSVNTEID